MEYPSPNVLTQSEGLPRQVDLRREAPPQCLHDAPDKLGAGLGLRRQACTSIRCLRTAAADPTHSLHPLVRKAVLLHGQGEVVAAMFAYVEGDDRVGGGSSRVSVEEAVEEGGAVDEAAALRFADAFEGDQGHGSTHGIEVRQVAQCHLQRPNACTHMCAYIYIHQNCMNHILKYMHRTVCAPSTLGV